MLDRNELLYRAQGRWCVAAFIVGACVVLARAAISSAAGQSESVIYAFNGGTGAYPYAPLVEQHGTLYGTTMSGGTPSGTHRRSGVFNGYGTVYALVRGKSGYAQQLLYSFKGMPDGANPYAGLLAGPNGTLYGTTCYGGTAQVGTVFMLAPGQSGYTETILHTFGGLKQRDGSCPYGSLIATANGTLLGTTQLGGATGCSGGCGTVFALVPNGSGYDEQILYRFSGRNDGHNPFGGLLADAAGALYGTTYYGGTHGAGSVFKLTPTASGYGETVVHSFAGGSDGAQPIAALVADKTGTLYGTTYAGGGAKCTGGCGTVFSLTPTASGYSESILHAFQGGTDGYFPYAGLVVNAKGVLYGTTFLGGGTACNKTGCGIVFALAPGASGYKETILHRFSGNDGAEPGATMLSQSGTLFGTTYGGGGILCFQDDVNCGTVFSLIMPRLTSR